MKSSLLHGTTVLASALLLFLVEPMVARALLPLYGGSPAVWNTCLVFFQGLLLVGYAWAHFGGRWLGARGQLAAHAAVALGALLLLPPRIPADGPAASAWPVPSLLAALALAVGAPFFVLSANASLVQKWHTRKGAPWFLYAASNAGSFVALLAYPFVVEPLLGLRAQFRLWTYGYLVFLLLLLSSMALAWRDRAVDAPAPPLPAGRRLRWTVRAAIPSSLLLAVSLAITTDVAAIPLLWVVPLALYLATFVIAFLPRAPFPRQALVVAGALLAGALLTLPALGRGLLALKLGLPLAALFAGSWLCHGDLARDRPDPSQLTDYYLWIAAGGFAGGVFGNLIAPRLFRSVAEYPLTLALLTVAFSVGDDQGAALWAALKRKRTWAQYALVAAPFALWMALSPRLAHVPNWWEYVPLFLVVVAAVLHRLPGMFAVACACAALVSVLGISSDARTVDARRSFFGVLRVRELAGERILVHGTTRHGGQVVAPFDPAPTLYYVPLSPLARVVNVQHDGAEIAVVGLGSGSLAYFTKPRQTMRYFEIDPIVEPLARRWFTFLRDAKGRVEVHLGDARLTMRELDDSSQDLIVVDAFSSDAIPVHLLTEGAVQLYLRKLKPGGVVALHISNRYLDLAMVTRAIARHLALAAAEKQFTPKADTPGAYVHMVALARKNEDLQFLFDRGWEELGPGPEVLWTDDRSALLPLLR